MCSSDLVPHLYSKPLKIVCIGGAEKVCREEYGNLGETSQQKKKFIDFFKENMIEYVGATQLLQLVPHSSLSLDFSSE